MGGFVFGSSSDLIPKIDGRKVKAIKPYIHAGSPTKIHNKPNCSARSAFRASLDGSESNTARSIPESHPIAKHQAANIAASEIGKKNLK